MPGKVVEYNGETVSYEIPLTGGQRERLPPDMGHDLKLYAIHDLFNPFNLNNMRVAMSTICSLMVAPLVYSPNLDLGALLQLNSYVILFILSSLIFAPGPHCNVQSYSIRKFHRFDHRSSIHIAARLSS